METKNDPLGAACLEYINGVTNTNIIVESDVAEDDVLPVNYLFRDFDSMPDLEKKALTLSYGKILDVGAGAGSHSLYLQNNNKEVYANEISPAASAVIQQRGIRNILNQDFFSLPNDIKYDTILMLMNGIGIVGTTERLGIFFEKVKQILAPNGCLLIDSSDLRYLFEEDDGSLLVNLNEAYYGEICYRMRYKNIRGKTFPWLFIDDELLKFYAERNGFLMEKIEDGPHYDYLAKLTVK